MSSLVTHRNSSIHREHSRILCFPILLTYLSVAFVSASRALQEPHSYCIALQLGCHSIFNEQMRTDTSVLLRPPACVGGQICPHINGGRSRSTRAARRPLRVCAVGWVSHIAGTAATIAPSSNYVFDPIEWLSAVSRSRGTCLQDPEGILAAPKGGHITRRTFQKQLAEDKTLLEQVEKEREAAREELQARRDVSACPQYRPQACALP